MNSARKPVVRTVILVSLLGLLGSCAKRADLYPHQPAVEVGSKLRLHVSGAVPLGEDRLYVQDQRQLGWESIDQERVYCAVVARGNTGAGTAPLAIEPGEFSVPRVRLYNDYVYRPVNYTNTDDNFYWPSFGVDYRTEIHLASSAQPHIHALYCTRHLPKYEIDSPYPDRSQIESTMGSLLELM